MSDVFTVSWDDFHLECKKLAQQLASSQRALEIPHAFDGLVAVTRGGLVPAAILASELNIRLIETVCIASYDEQNQRKHLDVIKQPALIQGRWLFVEDLVDSGETVKYLRSLYPTAQFASIYAKPNGREQVDYFTKTIAQDCWIELPWEV
ncbi:xanthine phosphoribosyltransferase [Catenovulum sediminis]|uniref:Xanthine phosphoribosyltransferase n=1 Tax=Catenovulum sediminis TaxID=1740262 RepID=A0ABV1RKU3_9ALTE|nr:xanthine phosphoribosyltransferase [Catenovulum sediminis]